jgi:hypothetical protein
MANNHFSDVNKNNSFSDGVIHAAMPKVNLIYIWQLHPRSEREVLVGGGGIKLVLLLPFEISVNIRLLTVARMM